jgi:hypothetical protein
VQIRRVVSVRGTLKYKMECKPTFDFGRIPHKVIQTPNGVKFECIDSKGTDNSLFLECTSEVEFTIR